MKYSPGKEEIADWLQDEFAVPHIRSAIRITFSQDIDCPLYSRTTI